MNFLVDRSVVFSRSLDKFDADFGEFKDSVCAFGISRNPQFSSLFDLCLTTANKYKAGSAAAVKNRS